MQEAFPQPDGADVEGDRLPRRAVAAEDELRRPAADVHHQHRLVEVGQGTDGPGVRQPGLLLARDDLRLDAEAGAGTVEELRGVGGVPCCGGGDHPPVGDPEPVEFCAEVGHGVQGAGERFGVEPAGRVHALAEPGQVQAPVHLDQAAVDQPAHQQADGVGAAVDGRQQLLTHWWPPARWWLRGSGRAGSRTHPAGRGSRRPAGSRPGRQRGSARRGRAGTSPGWACRRR